MKRSNRPVYLIAAIISVLLYVFGVMTGLFIQKSAVQFTEERLNTIQASMENTQLEYAYLNTLGINIPCDSIASLVDESTENVWDIGNELTQLERSGNEPEKVSSLTDEYYLLSVRAWILNSYVNERCHQGRAVVLFFYSVPCQECERQGEVFDQLKKEGFEDIRVFVLNFNSDQHIVQVLRKTYNITSVPAIVIGNDVYNGFIGKDTFKSLVSQPPS